MNGKLAKKLRNEAELGTIGKPKAFTRQVYRMLKKEHMQTRRYG